MPRRAGAERRDGDRHAERQAERRHPRARGRAPRRDARAWKAAAGTSKQRDLHGGPGQGHSQVVHRPCSFRICLQDGPLLGRELPLLDEPAEQLRPRPPEDAVDQVAQEPPGDVLVRPRRPVEERPLVVDLRQEPLVVQRAHEVGDRGVGPVQPRRASGRAPRRRSPRRAARRRASPRAPAPSGPSPAAVPSLGPPLAFRVWFLKFGFGNLADGQSCQCEVVLEPSSVEGRLEGVGEHKKGGMVRS